MSASFRTPVRKQRGCSAGHARHSRSSTSSTALFDGAQTNTRGVPPWRAASYTSTANMRTSVLVTRRHSDVDLRVEQQSNGNSSNRWKCVSKKRRARKKHEANGDGRTAVGVLSGRKTLCCARARPMRSNEVQNRANVSFSARIGRKIHLKKIFEPSP
jgi:hypothetical protein